MKNKKIKIPKRVKDQFNTEKHPLQNWDGKPIFIKKVSQETLQEIKMDIDTRGKEALLDLLDGEKWGYLDFRNPEFREMMKEYHTLLLDMKSKSAY